jgi:hypothetical protein
LAIIRSPLSTGLITSAALSSLHAFFIAGIISPRSPSIDTALSELSSTVSNCKFEATDSSGDEAVMLKILTVIEACICGSASEQLGDVEVCEMLETVLTTCCQMRLSGKPTPSRGRALFLNITLRDSEEIFGEDDGGDCASHVRPSSSSGSGLGRSFLADCQNDCNG